MAGTIKNNLKAAAKYGAVYGLGFLTAVAVFMATSDPMKEWYSTAISFDLDTGTHVVDGVEFSKHKNAALKYWREWQYVFRRHKLEELMLPWVEKDVVGAISLLASFNRSQAYAYRWWPSQRDAYAEKAKHWAREAAKHGKIDPMSTILLPHYAAVLNPTPEDVEIVERYAPLSRGAVYSLAFYYANQDVGPPRDMEKAMYWDNFYYTHQGFMPGAADRPAPVLTEERSLYR